MRNAPLLRLQGLRLQGLRLCGRRSRGLPLARLWPSGRAALWPAAAAVAVALTAQTARAGRVLRAGPTRTFTTIQQAVDAAVSGDLILVDPGRYAPFDVVGKGIAILADRASAPFVLIPSRTRPVLRIANLPAGLSVTVASFCTTVPFGAAAPLEITGCVGAVRIRDAVLEPTADLNRVPMRAVVEIRKCAAVSLYDVQIAPAVAYNGHTINGVTAPGGTDRGIAAVLAQDSGVHLVRCSARGYDDRGDSGRWGGDGLRLFGGSRARIDGTPTLLRGGVGGRVGGSAIQLLATRPVPDVLACAVNVGAYVPGPGPLPGGFFSINHDRGRIGGGVERFIATCLFESAALVRAPPRLGLGTTTDIRLASFFPRRYGLFLGPTGLRRFPGVENTAYLDFASPFTLLIAAGVLPTDPVFVDVPLAVPNLLDLRGFQFGVQAALGAPTGQGVPAASLSLAEIAVIVP